MTRGPGHVFDQERLSLNFSKYRVKEQTRRIKCLGPIALLNSKQRISAQDTFFSIFTQSNTTKILQILAKNQFSILKYVKDKVSLFCWSGSGCAQHWYCTRQRLSRAGQTHNLTQGRGCCTLLTTPLPLSWGCHPKVCSGFREFVWNPKGKEYR